MLSGLDGVAALASGMTAEHISFAGPGKSDRELQQAHAAGILINLESFRELDALSAASERSGRAARVAVRAHIDYVERAKD